MTTLAERPRTVTAEPVVPPPPRAVPPRLPDLIVGVDTHRDTYTAVVIDARGAVLAQLSVDTDTAGLSELHTAVLDLAIDLDAATLHNDVPQVLWAIEGSASYGASLRRFLAEHAETSGGRALWMCEVSRVPHVRGRAKNDVLDAQHIARHAHQQALDAHHAQQHETRTGSAQPRPGHATGNVGRPGQDTTRGRVNTRAPAQPRQGAVRAVMALILRHRRGNVAERTRLINRFKAAIVDAPETVRAAYRSTTTAQQLRTATACRPRLLTNTLTPTELEHHAYRQQLRSLAAQISALDDVIAADTARLDDLTNTHAAPLRAELGIGPVVAAELCCAHSHPGRIHSEAAFARLAGVAPLDVTSGQRQDRHRLDRSGDRHLNAAIHRIVIVRRQQHDPRTLAYYDRRTEQGRTPKDITRSLKRAIARHLYRVLEAMPALP